MLPEFRKAVSDTKKAQRDLDRLVRRVTEFGYPRTTTRRRKVSSPPSSPGVPESGLGGGESGAGAGPNTQA